MLRKRIVGPLAQPAVSVAEAVSRLAAMGWRRVRGNHIDSKPGIPIGLQPDVAPRKTSAGPAGSHSNRQHDRARQAHSCTAAPAGSAGA